MEIVIKFKNWILEFALWGTLINSLLLWKCVHPLVLCLLLISYSILTILIAGLLTSKWISYAIVLIFLGGIIIIFIYVTTLAGRDKFFIQPNIYSYLILARILFIPWFVEFSRSRKKEVYIVHIYQSSSPALWIAIIFLLTTLFVVVKLAESFKGALIKYS
jgi:hypothetical protein